MAERNSGQSSLGQKHFRGPSMGRGWEEAGAEFYQEFHGTMSSSGGDDRHNTTWETMLPSKQANTIDTRTWGRATNRQLTSKFGVRRNSASAADLEMETMPDLAQGFADEEETWNQLQQIRSLPVNMASKRELKAKIMHTPRFRVHGLAAFQLRRRQIWQQFRHSLAHFLSHFTLWRSSLHNIEANFGTGVGSYFLLIRWLFLLNVVIAALIAIFIILPWEIGQSSCPNLKQNQSDCSRPLLQSCNRTAASASCDSDKSWLDYTSSVIENKENRSSSDLFIQDILQGTGWMEITLSFYGYYQPALLQWGEEYYYDIGVGYQLTIFLVLILSLFCMANSVAQGFKDNIDLGKNWLHRYSDIAFASWDYCIDRARVADLNRKAILNAVRTALADDQYSEEKLSRTIRVKIRLFTLRVAVNSAVIGVLGVSGYIIYLVTYFSQRGGKLVETTKVAFVIEPLTEFLPSLVITTLNFIVPKLFRKFVTWERFSATFEIKVTLIRTVLLRLSSLLILIGTLYHRQGSLQCYKNDNCSLPLKCWETRVGQQLYRLCIFDAVATFTTSLLIRLPLSLVCRRVVSKTDVCNCITRPEFDLVGSILDLAYGQAICWMGVVYCPIIPVITAAKFFLVYYIKYLNLVVCSSAPSRLYGASSSTSLFMNVLLLSFITCVLPLGYHITALEPSKECGPYRGLSTVWALIAEEVSKLGPGVEILKFFGTAGFFVPLVLVLIVVLYYYRTKASAQRQLTDALKQQLILEGKDKQFLFNRLASASKQQSLPN